MGIKLETVIKTGESETVEFKKSTSELKEAILAIAAILNKQTENFLPENLNT